MSVHERAAESVPFAPARPGPNPNLGCQTQASAWAGRLGLATTLSTVPNAPKALNIGPPLFCLGHHTFCRGRGFMVRFCIKLTHFCCGFMVLRKAGFLWSHTKKEARDSLTLCCTLVLAVVACSRSRTQARKRPSSVLRKARFLWSKKQGIS
jgi:hypothetical protein